MSSYAFKAKNKETGEIISVWAIDDYFGKHRYGYIRLGEDETPLTEKNFYTHYLRVDEYPEKETTWNPIATDGEKILVYNGKVIPETPTLKGVEEWVKEFDKQFPIEANGWGNMAYDDRLRIYDFIRQTLLAREAAHEARLREVVKLVADAIEENTAFYEQKYGGNYEQCGRDIKFSIAQEAAKHGITNL